MKVIIPFAPHAKTKYSFYAVASATAYERWLSAENFRKSQPGAYEIDFSAPPSPTQQIAWGDGQILSSNNEVIQCESLRYWDGSKSVHVHTDTSERVYLLVILSPNSHHEPSCRNHSNNLRRVSSVSMPFFAYFLLEVRDNSDWFFDADNPRSHSHGWDLLRVRGNMFSSRICSEERDSERNKSTETWSPAERFFRKMTK